MSAGAVAAACTLPYDRILDLICNALDGGIGYWVRRGSLEDTLPEGFDAATIPWIDASDWVGLERYLAPLVDGGRLVWTSIDGDTCTLDLAAVHRGFAIMAEHHPRHFADVISENDDAITADVFVQCCVLGKLVYG